MKKKISIAFLSMIIVATTATSANEFEQWMKQQQTEFQEYKDKRDKEFTAFLKTNWKEMDLLKGVKRDPKPKPVSMPVAKPRPVVKKPANKPVVKPTPIQKPKSKDKPIEKPVVKAPVIKPLVKPAVKPKPDPKVVTKPPVKRPIVTSKPEALKPVAVAKKPVYKGRRVDLTFMGDRITIYYDARLRTNVPSRLNKQAISDIWSKLSKADYEPLLEQLIAIRKEKALNDWAFSVLVNDVSGVINGASDNSVAFLNWFVLIKAGYEARIAYDDHTLFLLLPTQQALFSIPYFTFDGIRFYSVNFDGKVKKLGRVYTYDGRYPDATQSLDMRLMSDMSSLKNTQTRKLDFEFNGKKYRVNADYDKSRVSFLETYPQLNLDMYFKSKVASKSAKSLTQQLAVHMEDMSQAEAVNFLLRFVQTSLPYKTDDAQFGKENYLFPEETLHYKYSDCEDRSILFTWLVRDLLGLEVVGLDYPGHVAAAVAFTEPVSGDKIKHNGKQFTVTDPTYINASAGMTMPDFKRFKPKVIAIN